MPVSEKSQTAYRYAIVPYVNGVDMTLDTVEDLLAQEGERVRVILIGNGATAEDRARINVYGRGEPRVWPWWYSPMLSLAAVWNQGLRFCWESGVDEALVVNNDVRLTKDTFSTLSEVRRETGALLVTATGVEGEEGLFEEAKEIGQWSLTRGNGDTISRGGPGFSCFLVSRECNERFPFDEALFPAFCEDLDLHRRMMLAGEGDRIFGTNVRYLHLGGQTLKAMSDEQRARHERLVSEIARKHYAAKWGGGANEETFWWPGGKAPEGVEPPQKQIAAIDHFMDLEITATCDLFDEVRKGWGQK